MPLSNRDESDKTFSGGFRTLIRILHYVERGDLCRLERVRCHTPNPQVKECEGQWSGVIKSRKPLDWRHCRGLQQLYS